MARIRTIKPEFWVSDQVVACSVTARLLFLGLLNFADDEGRHRHSIRRLKGEVLPCDDYSAADVAAWVGELARAGLIVIYRDSANHEYLHITGWKTHQRIDRPQPARYPDPADCELIYPYGEPDEFAEPSSSVRRPFVERSTNVPARREGIGKDKKGEDTISGQSAAPIGPGGEVVWKYPQDFETRFWAHYPKRVHKAAAAHEWQGLGIGARKAAATAAMQYKAWCEEQGHGGEPRIAQDAATFLRKGLFMEVAEWTPTEKPLPF